MIVRDLSARSGGFALNGVSFDLTPGGWGIVLGPTGAGKTTLLEAIAGVRQVTSGQVILRGTDATHVPPERRGVGIVYQHSFLFPHLTVEQNVRYGIANADVAREISDRFSIAELGRRRVHSLSGGERQLVALVRALAPQPDILLLDEPFAALDPRRRIQVRRELRQLQRERGMTVLHVTHDLAEAGTLGDLAIVLDAGRQLQVDTPSAVFRRPVSGAVADFVGAENIFAGTTVVISGGDCDSMKVMRFNGDDISLVGVGERGAGPGHAVIRESDITLTRTHADSTSARNVLSGVIEELRGDGILVRVTVKVGCARLVAAITADSSSELGLEVGTPVIAMVKATGVHLC